MNTPRICYNIHSLLSFTKRSKRHTHNHALNLFNIKHKIQKLNIHVHITKMLFEFQST